MIVQSVKPNQLAAFAKITDRPGTEERFAQMVQSMWDSGESRPEWCFIGYDDGIPVCRIGFFAIDGQPDVLGIMGWTLPWQANYLDLGRRLFDVVMPKLKEQQVRLIQRELYSSYGTFKQQAEILQGVGFELLQEQVVYELLAENYAPPAKTNRLRFEPADQVGKDEFNAIVARATADTKDRAIQKLVAKDGLNQFVDDSFEMLKAEHEVKPGWWNLAIEPDGSDIGFVQPVQFPNSTEGNIAYLGVVPPKRGNGYGFDLLCKGTELLIEDGITFINGRTDADNVPMQRVFEKLGYQRALQVSTYEITV